MERVSFDGEGFTMQTVPVWKVLQRRATRALKKGRETNDPAQLAAAQRFIEQAVQAQIAEEIRKGKNPPDAGRLG